MAPRAQDNTMKLARLGLGGLLAAQLLLSPGALSAATHPAPHDAPPREDAQALGFSAERLAAIDRFYAREVERGELAGIVLLIARHGRIAHFSALGYQDVEQRTPMRTDTLFRWYSMTKPLTSTALMMLYEEGRFQLTDPISRYLPEFAHPRVLRTPDADLGDTVPARREPTVQDILRHTAGFTHGLSHDDFDVAYLRAGLFGVDVSLAEMMQRLAALPLRYQPGTTFAYSVGPDVQARLIEVLSGMPFDRFLEERLFRPMGMEDTGFWVPPAKAQRLATVHFMKDGRLTPIDTAHGSPGDLWLSEPWTVNSYTVEHRRKGGSYGLVGTARDYYRFAQMLLNGGTLAGKRFLSPQTVRYMSRDHLGTIAMKDFSGNPSGTGFGLGFAVMQDPALAGYLSSVDSYFWAGYASTHFWIDPKQDLVVVALTQHIGVPAAQVLQGQLHALVYSAMLQ